MAMKRIAPLPAEQQFSLTYLLGVIALCAVALAAMRLALWQDTAWREARVVLYCIGAIAACGALGGLCLRMSVGLIAGGVFAVASVPLVWLVVRV